MTQDKYGRRAERWTADAYADARSYLAHRAELILSLGPPLEAGSTLLDLACGDGGLGAFLTQLHYVGVDASPEMVQAALAQGRDVRLGDLNDFEPDVPVAATTCFRAIYYARDRRAFFRKVAGYTERKLVFDLNPRQYRVREVADDLRAAGFDQLELRPFFSPQRVLLPHPLATALRGLERSGPLARVVLAVRFSYLCAVFRGGRKR